LHIICAVGLVGYLSYRSGQKAILFSAGCDDFLRKHFAEHTIFDAVSKHLGVRYILAQLLLNPVLQTGMTPEKFL
jgi:hypothetical protein